jgi:hypothetical protein
MKFPSFFFFSAQFFHQNKISSYLIYKNDIYHLRIRINFIQKTCVSHILFKRKIICVIMVFF